MSWSVGRTISLRSGRILRFDRGPPLLETRTVTDTLQSVSDSSDGTPLFRAFNLLRDALDDHVQSCVSNATGGKPGVTHQAVRLLG